MQTKLLMKSQCCNSDIIESSDDLIGDKCSKCDRCIQYAFGNEKTGVVQLINGDFYFFSHIMTKWSRVTKYFNLIYIEKEYLGQVDKVISTIGLMYNTQDIDMLPQSAFNYFESEYKDIVKNK